MMYIAVEMDGDDDGNINDRGAWCKSKKEAWQIVSGVFYKPNTIILNENGKVFMVKDKWRVPNEVS